MQKQSRACGFCGKTGPESVLFHIYWYVDIYKEISAFYESADTEKRIFGKSVFGRGLYAVKLGEGAPVGIAQYAIHGREWITAKLALAHFGGG